MGTGQSGGQRYNKTFKVQRPRRISLSHYFTRDLVFTKAEESRVAEFVVFGPLDETDLNDDLRSNPMRA